MRAAEKNPEASAGEDGGFADSALRDDEGGREQSPLTPGTAPVTLVTAIYERQPSDVVGGRGRPAAYYFDSLKHLVHLGARWVIYAEPAQVDVISARARSIGLAGEVVGRRLDEVPHFEAIQCLRVEQDVQHKPFRDRCHALCFGKLHWLAEEIASPRFGSEFVYWIDAGLAHPGLFPPRLLSVPERLFQPRVLSSLQSSPLVWVGHALEGQLQHDVPTDVMAALVGLPERPRLHVVGGIFGGAREHAALLTREFERVHVAMLDAGLLGTEENVLSLVAAQHPEWPVTEFATWHHEETDFVKVPPGTESFHVMFERWAGLLRQPPAGDGTTSAPILLRRDAKPTRTLPAKLEACFCDEVPPEQAPQILRGIFDELCRRYPDIDIRRIEPHTREFDALFRNKAGDWKPESRQVLRLINPTTGACSIVSFFDDNIDLLRRHRAEHPTRLRQLVATSGISPEGYAASGMAAAGPPLEALHAPFTYLLLRGTDLSLIGRERERIPPAACRSRGLVFRGYLFDLRNAIIEHLPADLIRAFDARRDEALPPEQYFAELGTRRLAFSLTGIGEICNRDMEILGLGLPLFRPELRCRFHEPLIPGVHYIAACRAPDGPVKGTFVFSDPRGAAAEIAANVAYWEDRTDELDVIARNGRAWFERNVLPERAIALACDLLDLSLLNDQKDAESLVPRSAPESPVIEWSSQVVAPIPVPAPDPPARLRPIAGDSETHFHRIWARIERGIPTVVARYGDGEQLLMEGRVISRSTQAAVEDGWWSDGGMTQLGRDLLETLSHREPNYFYAIPGHNDLAAIDFYVERLAAAPEQLTFANLFINRNYSLFRARLDALSEGAVVIASERGAGRALGNLRVIEYVPVGGDCVNAWEHGHEAEKARAADLARRHNHTLFLVAAGPLSKIWIHTMFAVNPTNRYIDVGSALDEMLFERKTRPYMHAGTQFADHVSRFEGRAPHVEAPVAEPGALVEITNHLFAEAGIYPAPTATPGPPILRPVDVTVVLNTYKRPHVLRQQYEAVINQTCPPADIFIWQNHPANGDALRVEPADFDPDILQRCITVTSRSTNFGVWGRFAFALNARTKYICMLDDDTIPGARWLENCLRTIETHRGLLGTIGIIQHDTGFWSHQRVGWYVPNDDVVQVDYVGHAWFFEREWLTAFWRELPSTEWARDSEPYALCAGEDIHFAYVLQKYLGLGCYVPPHPSNDRSLWGSNPEWALRYGTDRAAVSNMGDVKFDAAWTYYRARGFRALYER